MSMLQLLNVELTRRSLYIREGGVAVSLKPLPATTISVKINSAVTAKSSYMLYYPDLDQVMVTCLGEDIWAQLSNVVFQHVSNQIDIHRATSSSDIVRSIFPMYGDKIWSLRPIAKVIMSSNPSTVITSNGVTYYVALDEGAPVNKEPVVSISMTPKIDYVLDVPNPSGGAALPHVAVEVQASVYIRPDTIIIRDRQDETPIERSSEP